MKKLISIDMLPFLNVFYKLRKENIGQNKVYDIISGINEKFFDKSFNII